ncbi:hypothetical protein V5F44_20490 [Xanthobacter sp. V2C-8]|uniref:hypothetical protein n=1 Tax=Xanthobacter albus TaxID=3119929 RepID=UPI00372A0F06
MTDLPILFSSSMILAILREIDAPGTGKTQTRRAISQAMQDAYFDYDDWCRNVSAGVPRSRQWEREFYLDRVRIQPGDRLWVRETWAHYHTINHIRRTHGGAFSEVSDGLAGYRADGHDSIDDFREHIRLMSGCDLEAVEINGSRWRPSIHMPRWASRLTLYVSEVRVERLQDISEADAQAEGVECDSDGWRDYLMPQTQCCATAKASCATLWDSLNGPGAWEANPWVAAYTFAPRLGNIDTLPATLAEAA